MATQLPSSSNEETTNGFKKNSRKIVSMVESIRARKLDPMRFMSCSGADLPTPAAIMSQQKSKNTKNRSKSPSSPLCLGMCWRRARVFRLYD